MAGCPAPRQLARSCARASADSSGVAKPAGDTPTTARARPRRASSSATQPPSELPPTTGFSTPSPDRKSATAPASARASGTTPIGSVGDAPKPGRSTAITSRSPPMASITGFHACAKLPTPWISTTGSPEPVRVWASFTGVRGYGW